MLTRSNNTKEELEEFLSKHGPIDSPAHYSNGTQIGEWEITAFLGKGGSSEVYCARGVQGNQHVAIKIFQRNDERQRTRFRIEKEFLKRNLGRSFPHFYESGEFHGVPYLVMELLEPLPLPDREHTIAKYLISVAKGIKILHSLGYVHRDIKPLNILCRKDKTPVLIDFGLMKRISPVNGSDSPPMFQNSTIRGGTPQFSAPEQFYGGLTTPAADIHALGMLAFTCFRGTLPFIWDRLIQRSTSTIPQERIQNIDLFIRAIHLRYLPILLTIFLTLLLAGIVLSFCLISPGDEFPYFP